MATTSTHDQPSPSLPRRKKAQDYAFEGNWDGYFREVQGKGPRETMVHALARFEKEGFAPGLAVDLACGEGRDTLELLKRGWRVVAIDQSQRGIEMLREQCPKEHAERLEARVGSFADARWPRCDLLVSSFALPFCPGADFPSTWARIVESIRPGGRFAGQFFGDRDSWGRCGRTIMHPRTELDRLFEAFAWERLEEEEKDDLAGEQDKHWHVFHVVARKR